MRRWPWLVVIWIACLVVGVTGNAQISKFRSARFGGEDYVALADLARHFELGTDQGRSGQRAVYPRLVAQADDRRLRLDGIQHWLSAPVVSASGRLWIAKVDVLKLVDPVLRPSQFRQNPRATTVVLDPGHGGSDRGTRARSGRPEKELTLDFARRVASHLAGKGVSVLLTRRSDRTMALADRTTYARAKRADLFVSLHFNSAASSASGIETFCLPPKGSASTAVNGTRRLDHRQEPGNQFDVENVWLAHCLHRSLIRATDANDRGVRRARFQVLRDAPCPAVLVEAGFVSNRYEEDRILSVTYREALARAVADGMLKYIRSTGGGG